jgi:hypothetical protein
MVNIYYLLTNLSEGGIIRIVGLICLIAMNSIQSFDRAK